LLDRLLNLPFVKSAERQFVFDLRALKITGAKIDFLDHFLEGTARSARLENLDLNLARLRGAALRDFFQSLVRGKRNQPQGVALEFELKTAVAAEGKECCGSKARWIFRASHWQLTRRGGTRTRK
jgi:hypothetical protein